MSKKRRQHSAQFKAQVGLDALKGIEPVHAIAARHGVHPVQVSQWKKEAAARLPEVFAGKPDADAAEAKERRLDQILHGASLPQFLAKDVKAFDESLAELVSAHGTARTALSAATLENPATVAEARTKVETSQSLLKKVVDARLRLILRTGVIAGQSTDLESELKGLLQRCESALAEVTKVQAELTEMLRGFAPPASSPRTPPII